MSIIVTKVAGLTGYGEVLAADSGEELGTAPRSFIKIASNLLENDAVVVDGTSFQAVSSSPTGNQFLIGASAADTAGNLETALVAASAATEVFRDVGSTRIDLVWESGIHSVTENTLGVRIYLPAGGVISGEAPNDIVLAIGDYLVDTNDVGDILTAAMVRYNAPMYLRSFTVSTPAGDVKSAATIKMTVVSQGEMRKLTVEDGSGILEAGDRISYIMST